MSRQIQSRRGTAAEHENFIGAIGEITMDTTNKTLRVHDGTTPGGFALARADAVSEGATLPEGCDFVIESQFPSADNNYTWYRKYNSGWVEQGGNATSSNTSTPRMIALPVNMADTKYSLAICIARQSTTSPGALCVYEASASRTTSAFGCIGQWSSGSSTGSNEYAYSWIVAGMSA